jgi:hypothetical protein
LKNQYLNTKNEKGKKGGKRNFSKAANIPFPNATPSAN